MSLPLNRWKQAVAETLRQFGRIDGWLISRFWVARVVEEVPEDSVQKIYDVNVFGVLRMVRAVAPISRAQGFGRIINISSIAGRVVTPVNGIYSSTKFALEAVSDALRWELQPFGIKVIVIEPGPIRTKFDETYKREGIAPENFSRSPYSRIYKKIDEFANSMRSSDMNPKSSARTYLKSITAEKPKARYLPESHSRPIGHSLA
jgi:NAD(P)-dependent dehydrogenase (short-subunit alcohol dehydrogenase family)